MRKRCLSILLVLALCLAFLPVQAHAVEVTEITVTGLTNKYRTGDLISVDLGGIYVSGNGDTGVTTDGKELRVDGTTYDTYPWDTSLTWEAGTEYTLVIPMSISSPDTLNTNVCTINGETVSLSDVGTNGATLYYTIYAASEEASFTTEPTAKTGLTYNGSAQALVNAGSSNEGTLQYKFMGTEDPEWSNSIPTAKDAGTYEILCRIKGNNTHLDYEPGTPIVVTIDPSSDDIVVRVNNQTVAVNEDLPANSYRVTGLKGSDSLTGTPVYTYTDGTVTLDDPREEGPGEYGISVTGLSLPTSLQNNYSGDLTFYSGTLTVEEENHSYDFEQPETGVGSGRRNANSWTWGERANLPIDVAKLYTVLVKNSAENRFLAEDDTWALPAVDPTGPTYQVDEALVCEDHEPEYFANGDGNVDESTFGNSDFYIVGVGTGDTKVDYPNLKTGDVVSNTKFNGVYVTKLQKTANATYDADLAKLKSDCIASFRAFELDHPEVFWLNGSVKLRVLTITFSGVQSSYIFMTLVDDGGFTMRIADYNAAGAIEAAIAQRDAAVAAIIAQIPENATTPRLKIASLNKWFTLHNEYNRSADLSAIGYTPHRALKALMGNYGENGPVCDGYSRAVKVVCDKLGIPAILDTGVATNGSHSELHMWNRIKIDGTWYGFDCTWDDPIVKGKNGVVSGYENENFLLVGNDTIVNGGKFGVTHPSNATAGGTTGVLFATLTVNPEAIEGYLVMPFTDVRLGDWFYDQVKTAYTYGIVGGVTKTTYVPQPQGDSKTGTLTHGQIMVMVANLHSLQKGDNFKGYSVPGDHWAASFRDYCKKEGIIDDRFDDVLDEFVTRAEMAYYFANCLKSSSYKNKKSVSLSDIGDNPYKAQITKLAKADIVGGYPDGTFLPDKLVTRAEAAVFITNVIAAIKN